MRQVKGKSREINRDIRRSKDVTTDYESVGSRFESCQAHQ